jgi:hypothetical protein
MFPKKGNKLHQPRRGTGTKIDFNRSIAAALRAELGSTHQAAKTVMRWTGVSERTAKNWLSGDYGPNGENLVRLLRNSDQALQALLVLANRRGSMPEAILIRIRQHLEAAIQCLDEFD